MSAGALSNNSRAVTHLKMYHKCEIYGDRYISAPRDGPSPVERVLPGQLPPAAGRLQCHAVAEL